MDAMGLSKWTPREALNEYRGKIQMDTGVTPSGHQSMYLGCPFTTSHRSVNLVLTRKCLIPGLIVRR